MKRGKTLPRIYLTLAILLFGVGVGMDVRWCGGIFMRWWVYLIPLVPGILLLCAAGIAARTSHKVAHGAMIFIILLGVGTSALYCSIIDMLHVATTVVTNPGRYEEIRKEWPEKLVADFPASIPGNAIHVHFSYLPRFMMGGPEMQLRYTLPPEELKGVHERFLQMRNRIPSHKPTVPFALNDISNKGERENHMLSDYEILSFESKYDTSQEWQHGVAINLKTAEIVFWAQD